MKKRETKSKGDEPRREYDFRGGVRGKYAARYRAGTNVVLLDPDVAEAFPDSAAVNRVLRAFATGAYRETRGRSRKQRGGSR
jgi:hypothetical protein